MQLRLDALQGHLSSTLAPLYIISSNEPLLALEAADSIRFAARQQNFTEREVLVVERTFKWESLIQATQTQSLFGDKKLIELRVPTGKPGKDGGKILQDYVKQLTSDNLTMITLPKLDFATQKTAWFTALKEAGVWLDIPVIERHQLPQWITQRLSRQKQSTNEHAVQFIADRVEGNLLAAHQEIQKLGLLYPAGTLSFEQVQDAVLNVARYDVFKLNEAMLSGNTARFVRMMRGLEGEGEALPLVLWAVSEEIRTMVKLKTGLEQGRPLPALLKEYRIWGPRERLIGQALQRNSLSKLTKALQDTAQIDRMIKGLKSNQFAGDTWDALSQVGLHITSGT